MLVLVNYSMGQKVFFVVMFLFIITPLLAGSYVFALDKPDFPSCANPNGTVRVRNTEGNHGIVGSTAVYGGEDTVYSINGDTHLTQCLCSTSGEGIQTNWWKVSSLSSDEQQILRNEGWYYIPDGALWGLDRAPYMAINSNYSCQGGGTGGEVLGTSISLASSKPSILGLATTGSQTTILGFLILGLAFTASGILLKKSSK